MNPVQDDPQHQNDPRPGALARECARLRGEVAASGAVLDEAAARLSLGFAALAEGLAGQPALRGELERMVLALQSHDVLSQMLGRIGARLAQLEALAGGTGPAPAAPTASPRCSLQPGEIELF